MHLYFGTCYACMNPHKFTIKSQEALQSAQKTARERKHQVIENAHILHGLLEIDDNRIPFLLKKLQVNSQILRRGLNSKLEGFPKCSEKNSQYFSSKSLQTLNHAENLAERTKDSFISIEHLLWAILKAGDSVSQLLKDQGVTESY